ncbi:MAG: hypothetical protein IJ153_11285 [Clostridia bacterium]|nr:hypothetical protein [Clostridia bacterium]MBQ9212269.1 hypothetical protein [Clostridia bacterium]
MNYKRCLYFVEGPCEKQFIEALNRIQPYRLLPGKVEVFNIVQEEIPRKRVNAVHPGTIVVFVFDTDVNKTDVLKKNIEHVKKYASEIKIMTIAQVLNFEDEFKRSTDVKKVQDFTRSATVSEFKTAFCQMKQDSCRYAMERHKLDLSKTWATTPPQAFSFVSMDGEKVKIV